MKMILQEAFGWFEDQRETLHVAFSLAFFGDQITFHFYLTDFEKLFNI